MSVQDLQPILDAAEEAMNRGDVDTLRHLAGEAQLLTTPEAPALAEKLLGAAASMVGSYNESLQHFQHALEQYAELGDLQGIATVTGNIGAVHNLIGDYDRALDILDKARNLHREIADRSGEVRVVSNMAMVHQRKGNYNDALTQLHHALEAYQDLENKNGIARVLGNIGIVYDLLGDASKALDFYGRALALHEERGDIRGLASVTGNIGMVHLHHGEYAKASEQFHHSLAYSERINDRHGIAFATSNLGSVYRIGGDYPQALQYYHQALSIYEILDLQSGIAETTSRIGIVYVLMGSHQKALEHYQRALSMFQALGERPMMAVVTGNVGDLYFSMGDHANALDCFTRARALDRECGRHASVIIDEINLTRLHIAMGDVSLAEQLLASIDVYQNMPPQSVIAREVVRAEIMERKGEITEAQSILQGALKIAEEYALPKEEMGLNEQLRELALKLNDLAAYVEHNSAFTRIKEQINGSDAATKLAMQEVDRKIAAERQEAARQLAILHSTLPKEIAERISRGETVNDHHDNAVVIFLDIVGFTTHSARIDATDVVKHLEMIFSRFDTLCANHHVTKIKTIGDSYMAVAFPADGHIINAAALALDMLQQHFTWPDSNDPVQFRIGLHVGPVVAGVIGTERLQYDVWGDTVNVASRLETTSEAGKIHVSETFASLLSSNHSPFPVPHSPFPIPHSLVNRGSIELKGKGMVRTYWLLTQQ